MRSIGVRGTCGGPSGTGWRSKVETGLDGGRMGIGTQRRSGGLGADSGSHLRREALRNRVVPDSVGATVGPQDRFGEARPAQEVEREKGHGDYEKMRKPRLCFLVLNTIVSLWRAGWAVD